MKISVAQLHYQLKNESYNLSLIKEKIQQANDEKSDIILFSSLYEKDFYSYEQIQFVASMDIIQEQIQTLLPLSQHIGIVVPFLLKTNQRKRTIFYYLYQGNIEQKIFDYQYLYGEGYHYEFSHKNHSFGVYFFEDIITNNKANFIGQIHKNNLPLKDTVLIFANANFGIQTLEQRYTYLREFVKHHSCQCIFLNTSGEYIGDVFEGRSCIFDKQQNLSHLLHAFQEDIKHVDTNRTYNPLSVTTDVIEEKQILKYLTLPHYISSTYEALKIGISDYFHRSGFSKAVIGLSGGIDSAVVACIATDVLGKENITGLLMPSPFSTTHSIEDALELAKNLGIHHHIVSIEKMYHMSLNTLQPLFQNLSTDVTEENLQSRIRGLLLMAFSNKHHSLLLNTSNKSELSAGYGTLYGDLCGALSVLGDLYKTQVYALANYINRIKNIIPQNIIHKVPSAELRPNQKDTDSLPEYELLDQILYLYIDKKISLQSIIKDYKFDKNIVVKVIDLYKKNRYKAIQICDILKVSI